MITLIERWCLLNIPHYQHQAEPQFLRLGSCAGEIETKVACLLPNFSYLHLRHQPTSTITSTIPRDYNQSSHPITTSQRPQSKTIDHYRYQAY
jgi:hypothetical protein